jgi:ubiquitin-protein ligase
MDINRIRREFAEAQKIFPSLALYPTSDGKVFAKAPLETAFGVYVLSVRFPETYPYEMPKVTIDAPTITSAPHRYQGGALCYLHPSMWNPGIHDFKFVVARSSKWLSKFEVWKRKGYWPGAEISH